MPVLDYTAGRRLSKSTSSSNDSVETCMDSCRISLVESIPVGINYSNDSVVHRTIHRSWMELIGTAQDTIEIASSSFQMRGRDGYPDDTAEEGEEVLQALLEAGRQRGVKLRIVRDGPESRDPSLNSESDSEYLAKEANAQVRYMNFTRLLGGGFMHTKFWLIDRTHLYVGSASTDRKAIIYLKELGVVALNCSCLANDLAKIFDVYWKFGEDGIVPPAWPESLGTKINMDNPLSFTIDGNTYRSYIVSSPPLFTPEGRTDELAAILHYIDKAERFIYISVKNYLPLTKYTPTVQYWPVIDNALRSAAFDRKIDVKLLTSLWEYSSPSAEYFLRTLVDMANSYRDVKIEVKRFIVPTMPQLGKKPYLRFNHNKYMVTDNTAYIGMSSFSGDYFMNTTGIGMVFEDDGQNNQDSIRQQLENIFHRDWNSPYAHPQNISNFDMGISGRTKH